MLKTVIMRKAGGGGLPANLTTLSASWLNGQFKAVAIHRGMVGASWERQEESDTAGNFERLIREAVQQTGYRGQTVSLLVAHPRLAQPLVEVPPVKGAMLKKVLQQQAQHQKMFPGEAAWAIQGSFADRPSKSVILHLFPKALLDQLVLGCKRNGLRLTAVIPASAVLHSQLSDLPLENGETALLAAETAGSVTVVVGRRDGQIFLARTLPGNWNEGSERLAVDLNRTILFVNQQYGVTVDSGIWLFGRRTAEQLAALQRLVQLPIKASPVQFQPFYWATECVKLKPQLVPNLISLEEQQAPQRRVFAKVVAISTAVVLFLSVAAALYSSLAARQEKANIRSLTAQLTRLQDQRQVLQLRNNELASREKVIKLVLEERPAPVPLWFLAYLGQSVPEELVVTNLSITRASDLWNVRLAGTVQATNDLTPASVSRSLALLRANLTGPPFNLKLLGEQLAKSATSVSTATNSGVPDWVARVTTAEGGKAEADQKMEDHFLIEGSMR
jgi:hypothetical protein